MPEEEIKQAFSKVKQDIFTLGSEIQQLKSEILDLKSEIRHILSSLDALKTQLLAPTHQAENPTIPTHNPTHPENPTDNLPYYALKQAFSTGNEGVPTDKQTDRQTDQHIQNQQNTRKQDKFSQLDKAAEILSSLDSLKKEIRIKIKALTSQEIAVFSMLYSLEEQGNEVDYKLLATTLSLSESSIRDYIIKIQKKGIPITKEKLNNKRVILHISQDLKKIASLDTILKLREL